MGLKLGIGRLSALLLLTSALGLATASSASAFEYITQYGNGYPGGGNGQVSLDSQIAVAPDGTVAAADIGGQRVELFAQSGKFLRAFGTDVSVGGGEGAEICTNTCKMGAPLGTAAGDLYAPWGVAAQGDEIYVSELSNERISVFDEEGRFLRAFGADVGGPGINVCSSTCGPGTAGVAAGQMAGPAGLALDASGRLYVSEVGSDRVDVFDPRTGQFLLAFGKDVGGPGVGTCTTACSAGTADASPGALKSPFGLAIGGNAEVFVAENTGTRISVFNEQGQPLRQFGSSGSGAGQLSNPQAVAVDKAGNVYVADTANQRISVFGTAGDFRFAFGGDVIPGAPVLPETCTTLCKAGMSGGGIGEFLSPYGLGSDCRGAIYIGNTGRIEKWGDPGARKPPCESNAFSFGKVSKNKKKGTLTAVVDVPGAGSLSFDAGKSLSATAPQPVGPGAVLVTIKATGKGVKSLTKTGKLKGSLSVTFAPPNEDPKTQSESVQLAKTAKKHKKPGKHKHGKHHH